jgi:hypothetical protein
MKAAASALALLIALAAPAAAGSCADELKKIDAALASEQIAPDVKAQVQDMRNQAEQLCSAQNQDEGMDILQEAAAILGIE